MSQLTPPSGTDWHRHAVICAVGFTSPSRSCSPCRGSAVPANDEVEDLDPQTRELQIGPLGFLWIRAAAAEEKRP